MSSGILEKLKGDRKYFAIVFFILVLVFACGIITPIIVKNVETNWEGVLSGKITEIQNSVTALFNEHENKLLEQSKKIKNELRRTLDPNNSSYADLLKLVNRKDYEKISIEVLAPNGKLIAWNNQIAVQQNDILPLSFPAGEAHFYSTNLITYLTVTDTINVDGDQFYYVVSAPFEKHYKLNNQYYEGVNFTKTISEKFLTQFEMSYTPFDEKTNDGRKYSFEIFNNAGNKIGLVTFYKPALDIELNSIYETANDIQSILIVVGFVFLCFGFKKDFSKVKYRAVKMLIFALGISVFRALLFYTGIPSNFIEGGLAEPSYFSSTFGGGIVKSPIEFFITVLLFLIIVLKGFSYLQQYLETEGNRVLTQAKIFWIILVPAVIIFVWIIRGFASSIKSVIFDSTLRYFKEPNLIPNLPSILMNLNVLLFGISIIVILCGLIIFLSSFLKRHEIKKQKRNFLYLFLFFQVTGQLFLIYENEPLLSPFLNFLIITLVFVLSYKMNFVKSNDRFNFIYAAIAASIFTIALMNFFNIELEKVSLRTTAFEINRPNDNLLHFIISEALSNAAKNKNCIESFYNRYSNYNSEAFLLWANSSLQKESLNSSINIYDKNLSLLGSFSAGDEIQKIPLSQYALNNSPVPQIIELSQRSDSAKKIVIGIIPVIDRGIKIGYLSASISYDLKTFFVNNIPDFLESKRNLINSVLDINNLKIFLLKDSKLSQVYGDIYPSFEQIKPIINAGFNADNEAWLNLNLNGENFIVFALRNFQNGAEKITAVATGEKKISWDLFNFFKIFLVHSIFILVISTFIFLTNIKTFRYSFRAQLMIALLFVSIIPVIILAIYSRQIFEDKKQSAILEELNERTIYLENNIREEIIEVKNGDIIKAFQNAARDMKISFGIYNGNNQIYNSRDQFYKAGLFTNSLNPQVYYELNYLNYREYLAHERIDNYVYDSYYKKVNFGDRTFIIGVNDAFNKVHLSFSVVDLDVFLFGVYSFATLLMIILSAILANRISSPVRRLTTATSSIAHGDFNVQLNSNQRGEIKELFNGFNFMTRELQKNQTELAELERENAWKEMAKQVAHEIKNPLTPMKLAMQQLLVAYKDKNINLDSIFEKVSSTILNQIENLSLIASEFSRFARMPNLNLERIDLINIMNDTVNLFIEEKIRIKIYSDVDDAVIESDKSQLRRMFINLIRNSIQAEAKNILISLRENEKDFVVMISDDGKGIPAEIQNKVFDSNFTTKSKGMGLGLKMSKRFLENIGGSICLEGKQTMGCEFKITIPKFKG